MENRELMAIAIPVDCIDDLCRILNVEEDKLLRRLEMGIDTENNNITRINKCREILDYITMSIEGNFDEEEIAEEAKEEEDDKPLGFSIE